MKLITKRFLYSFFILLFFIITPVILAFASGYRFNTKMLKFEKTGSLIVESVPKNSNIFINGKLYKTKTPAKINYLLGDAYELEINKNGYFPWKNNIKIVSNLVTFIKTVYLTKQEAPRLVLGGDVVSFQNIPGSQNMIIQERKNNEIVLMLFDYDKESLEQIKSFPLDSEIYFIGWSNNNKKLLFESTLKEKKQFFILNTEVMDISSVFDTLQIHFNAMQWDFFDNTLLYGSDESGLYQIDLALVSTKKITNASIKNFVVASPFIYHTSLEKTGSYLKRSEISNSSKTQTVKIPDTTQYFIELISKDLMLLTERSKGDSFIIKTKIFSSENKNDMEDNTIFEGKIKNIRWTDDKNRFLYSNDFELYIFDVTAKTEKLINRFGVPIKNIGWALNENSIVYQLDNTLYITDAKPYNEKNVYLLAQGYPLQNFSIEGRMGNSIWINGKINDNGGLFIYTLISPSDLPFFEQVMQPQASY
ncbi:MAG: hypothetical protein US74_C0003G0014 [Parcubacteria group bacterium GW2011_GWA2_38_13]|nr:MAG: hypothetical protein US74_C0003G0014 [Parcubacteria group bacterium GW2011_GWA2_38_13]